MLQSRYSLEPTSTDGEYWRTGFSALRVAPNYTPVGTPYPEIESLAKPIQLIIESFETDQLHP
jgi:hypothetical protein